MGYEMFLDSHSIYIDGYNVYDNKKNKENKMNFKRFFNSSPWEKNIGQENNYDVYCHIIITRFNGIIYDEKVDIANQDFDRFEWDIVVTLLQEKKLSPENIFINYNILAYYPKGKKEDKKER